MNKNRTRATNFKELKGKEKTNCDLSILVAKEYYNNH